ncbi:MAG TPA: sensor histidine kinase [Elainellaceae cyanobacterium]
MFQTTRRRLALWYTLVTATLLILFASGFYLYVRNTLVERVDDTLNHVVEVIQRSLVIEHDSDDRVHVNVEASFRDNAETVEDDHIDLEWFDPTGILVWSTFDQPLDSPLHFNSKGETVHFHEQLLRQVTQRVQMGRHVLGYLRVSHPWFEVTKPIRQLIVDLSWGTTLMVGVTAAIGWLLSGLAMAPVRDSYQRLKQFTADASHELRNPIAVIQTNVQVALSDPDPQFQHDQLEVVERITRRLGRLVDDLLFLARQDSGIVQLSFNPISIHGVLSEVIDEQQAIASEKHVQLVLKHPTLGHLGDVNQPDPCSPLYLVQGDRNQLTRLFTNLLGNAIQYTPSGGEVHITLTTLKRNNDTQTAVQIRDTGVGIPSNAIPHLFDRFYQVDSSRSHRTGSGLGLAIARAIAENHQGQIQLTSTPGEGTIVTVTLPDLSET